MKQSNGGFGCYMLLAHEWANPAATHRSFELISQHVFPEFQGQGWSTTEARARARASRPEMAAQHLQAVEEVTARYRAEVGPTSRLRHCRRRVPTALDPGSAVAVEPGSPAAGRERDDEPPAHPSLIPTRTPPCPKTRPSSTPSPT